MSSRIQIELQFRTAEGVYRLKARITPGSDTDAQVLNTIEYLIRREQEYKHRTAETVLLPAQTVSQRREE